MKLESDSESDVPLAKQPQHKAKLPPKPKAQAGSDSDEPLGKLKKQKVKIEKAAEKEAKAIRADEKKKQLEKRNNSKPQKKRIKQELSDDEDAPLSSKKPVAKKAKVTAVDRPVKDKGKGKAKVKKEEEEVEGEGGEEEDENQWWNNPMHNDGTNKWTVLEHNGVIFPPPHQPLPKNVRLKYDGVPVKLPPESEEVAFFYGSMLNSTVNVTNPTFNKNFFADFKEVLDKTGHGSAPDGKKIIIKEFDKLDFNEIWNWFFSEREAKKARPQAEKKAEKARKEEVEAPFMYCKWDGRKQKVGNFRVEPPSLFRGRGEHPKTGRVKQRIMPEQITINVGKEATVPTPPEGHRWKEVKHDRTGTWLAMWQENINGAYKYVMLAANSDVKGKSDYKKFEKARELKKYIDKIRADYEKGLKAEMMADRQRATAMYLIDRLALRAGNEKGEDEADTVGCCSLKYEHVTLKPPRTLVFDFLGKDSIRFHEEIAVDLQVFKNIQIFKKPPKKDGDEIFDRLNTSGLNKHLHSYMEGLTAKVFRTYNASQTMSNLLRGMKSTGNVAERVKDYNEANKQVAILCNHKRTVAASHAGQMEKLSDKINGVRYQQWRIKQMMLDVDPKQKKKKGADYFELPEELTKEWIEEHQAALVAEQRQKIEKKFQKENEKLAAEGQSEMKMKELNERLQVAEDLAKKFKAENKKNKVEAEGKSPSVEKLEEQVAKIDQRIATMQTQAEDKDNNKEVSLGTSKIVSAGLSKRLITLVLTT